MPNFERHEKPWCMPNFERHEKPWCMPNFERHEKPCCRLSAEVRCCSPLVCMPQPIGHLREGRAVAADCGRRGHGRPQHACLPGAPLPQRHDPCHAVWAQMVGQRVGRNGAQSPTLQAPGPRADCNLLLCAWGGGRSEDCPQQARARDWHAAERAGQRPFHGWARIALLVHRWWGKAWCQARGVLGTLPTQVGCAHPILSYPILSYPILSYPILSCLDRR